MGHINWTTLVPLPKMWVIERPDSFTFATNDMAIVEKYKNVAGAVVTPYLSQNDAFDKLDAL